MPDRYPVLVGASYAAPGAITLGRGVDELRSGVLAELKKVEVVLRTVPSVAVNAIPILWAPGSLLSIASAATAPASGVRGTHPVAVYGDAVDRQGSVSFRVVIPGRYRLTLLNSTDAPGGGTVRWTVTTGILGADLSGVNSGLLSTSAGPSASITIDGPVTNKVLWTPCGDLLLYSSCEVGVTVRRNAGTAPDTGASAAYIVGVSLERQADR